MVRIASPPKRSYSHLKRWRFLNLFFVGRQRARMKKWRGGWKLYWRSSKPPCQNERTRMQVPIQKMSGRRCAKAKNDNSGWGHGEMNEVARQTPDQTSLALNLLFRYWWTHASFPATKMLELMANKYGKQIRGIVLFRGQNQRAKKTMIRRFFEGIANVSSHTLTRVAANIWFLFAQPCGDFLLYIPSSNLQNKKDSPRQASSNVTGVVTRVSPLLSTQLQNPKTNMLHSLNVSIIHLCIRTRTWRSKILDFSWCKQTKLLRSNLRLPCKKHSMRHGRPRTIFMTLFSSVKVDMCQRQAGYSPKVNFLAARPACWSRNVRLEKCHEAMLPGYDSLAHAYDHESAIFWCRLQRRNRQSPLQPVSRNAYFHGNSRARPFFSSHVIFVAMYCTSHS